MPQKLLQRFRKDATLRGKTTESRGAAARRGAGGGGRQCAHLSLGAHGPSMSGGTKGARARTPSVLACSWGDVTPPGHGMKAVWCLPHPLPRFQKRGPEPELISPARGAAGTEAGRERMGGGWLNRTKRGGATATGGVSPPPSHAGSRVAMGMGLPRVPALLAPQKTQGLEAGLGPSSTSPSHLGAGHSTFVGLSFPTWRRTVWTRLWLCFKEDKAGKGRGAGPERPSSSPSQCQRTRRGQGPKVSLTQDSVPATNHSQGLVGKHVCAVACVRNMGRPECLRVHIPYLHMFKSSKPAHKLLKFCLAAWLSG